MQFTPQQMAGYKGYSPGVLVGNWSEDIQVQEDKLRTFQARSGSHAVDPVAIMTSRVSLAPGKPDGFVRFGSPLQLKSLVNGGGDDLAIALDTTLKRRPKLNHALVTLSASQTPQARSLWTIRKTKDASNASYDRSGEGDILHYGQMCRIVNEYGSADGFYALTSEKATATTQSRGGKQLVCAGLGAANDMVFVFEAADGSGADGQPVPAGAKLVIRHGMTRTPLLADAASRMTTIGGAEMELCAHMAKLQATKVVTPQTPPNFWTVEMGPAGGPAFKPPAALPTPEQALDKVRRRIIERAGGSGFRAVVRSLRLMDDDGSRSLSRAEFKDGMTTYGVPLSTADVDHVFSQFDRNGDGTITITEFLRTLRGPMKPRRLKLVKEAFTLIDHDGSGVVTFDELKTAFGKGLPQHPAIKAGTKTEQEVLKEFVADWDKSGDGKVTQDEFVEYYADLSANIDHDDYFELMIRNAWHMSGGEGWAENTSNKRVLVVHSDDSQEVIELINDLGVDVTDVKEVRKKLESQGVVDIKRIELAS